MNHLSDELINKYIDKEASGEELELINEHLSLCDDCAAKIKAGRLTESVLARMNAAYSLPDDFTNKIMAQVVKPDPKAVNSTSFFIKTVFSLFILAIGGAVGYGFSMAVSAGEASSSEPGELDVLYKNISDFFASIQLPSISMAHKLPNGMEIIGAAIIIAAFTAFYYIYELQKELKKRTEQLR